MRLDRKDLLAIEDLRREELALILDTAASFKEVSEKDIKKVPTLRGRTIINLFYEPSTRTRTSFEIAAKRMSSDAVNISVAASSVTKGETLSDTARNLEAMRPDCIVVRHNCAGTPAMLAERLSCSVVNAGDGAHEHPSQALLDMFTIREKMGRLKGLKVAIIGDITHSRVARSNIHGLTKMGAEVMVAGPATMLPIGIEDLGCRATTDPCEAIRDAHVVMMLRIQFERLEGPTIPSAREYSRVWGLDKEKLGLAAPGAIVMHPGPMNRGVEISPEVADGPNSLILEQVTNGVAIRMAIFYLLLGAVREEE